MLIIGKLFHKAVTSVLKNWQSNVNTGSLSYKLAYLFRTHQDQHFDRATNTSVSMATGTELAQYVQTT